MSTSYNIILRQAALRINAIVGVTAAALETSYATTPLTTSEWQSPLFTLQSVKDALLIAEEQVAHAIASVREHPWRAYLDDTTAALSSGVDLPKLSANSKEIIGVWGGVYDTSDGAPLEEKPLAEVRRVKRNSGSRHLITPYYFAIDDKRIYHTRTQAYIDCCVYDASAQATAINSNGTMLLPKAASPALLAGVLAQLTRDDEFVEQARVAAEMFAAMLADIKQGLVATEGTGKEK
jgi:hypothetical protein